MPELTEEQLNNLLNKLSTAIDRKRGANLSREETMIVSTFMVLFIDQTAIKL